jgi:hypothetical protein
MPTDYGSIRQGLANALAPLNTPTSWIQITPYMIVNPTPPHIQIMPGEITYDIAGRRGGDELIFVVQGFVVANFDVNSQKKLDQMLADGGPMSVKALVEADRRLGGVIDDLRVRRNSGYNVYSLQSRGPVLGADWEVEVVSSTV